MTCRSALQATYGRTMSLAPNVRLWLSVAFHVHNHNRRLNPKLVAALATRATKERNIPPMLKPKLLVIFCALCLTVLAAGQAHAQCAFSTSGRTMTLNADCTTEHSISVPNGFTLNGAGH